MVEFSIDLGNCTEKTQKELIEEFANLNVEDIDELARYVFKRGLQTACNNIMIRERLKKGTEEAQELDEKCDIYWSIYEELKPYI